MRKGREGRSKRSKKTQMANFKEEEEEETERQMKQEEDDEEEEVEGDSEESENNKGFFACYLLCSNCPRFKGHTYIGFTVNPRRRIRQHNGELRSGAWRTKSKRPWEMILCIYGFPTNVTALQFEWAWQHPRESLAVREAAASLKSVSGIVGKIKLVYMMLTLPPWERLKLTVNFFSTKYMKDAYGCKSLPKQMKVQFGSMDELPCYTGHAQIFDELDDQDCGDKDADNGTDQTLLEGPTDSSVHRTSDCHVSSAGIVHGTLKPDESDVIEFAVVFTHSIEDEPVSPNGVEGAHTLVGVDHTLPYHMADSPLPLSSRISNLANSGEIVDEKNSYSLTGMDGKEFKQTAQQPSASLSARTEHQLSSANSLFQSPELSYKQNDLSVCMKEGSVPQFSLDDTPEKIPVSNKYLLVKGNEGIGANSSTPESIGLEILSSKPSSEPTSTADDAQLLTTKGSLRSHEVEVIDIPTPPSIGIAHTFRQRKKRNNWNSKEVIDLTESPKVVQL